MSGDCKVPKPRKALPEVKAPIEFMGGYTRSQLGQGAALGFGDEVEAGIRAGLAKAGGDERDIAEIYSEQLDKIRGEQKQFSERHPVISTGGCAP